MKNSYLAKKKGKGKSKETQRKEIAERMKKMMPGVWIKTDEGERKRKKIKEKHLN